MYYIIVTAGYYQPLDEIKKNRQSVGYGDKVALTFIFWPDGANLVR